jgi:hypothetical protein
VIRYTKESVQICVRSSPVQTKEESAQIGVNQRPILPFSTG